MKPSLWTRLALLLALTACSAPERGALEPITEPGITLVKTHGLPEDTARLSSGGVIADVTGAWSNRGESIEIDYRAGPSAAAIEIASSANWKDRIVHASAAWDRSVAEPGNALGRPLLNAGPLNLAGKDRRTVQIEYDRVSNGERPALGDEVVIVVPMPDGPQPVKFRFGTE